MNNIVIGVVCTEQSIDSNSYECVKRSNLRYLNNKCSYIGIMMYDKYNFIDTSVLDNVDGIIFQGGTNIYPYYYQILEYAFRNNIPVLGICMGMQLMGLYFNKQSDEDLVKVGKHYNTTHKIINKEGSLLYRLYGKEIEVNSRHNYVLEYVDEPLVVGSVSEENYLEEIECIDEDCFLVGVQFHPEDMDNFEKLYNYFIRECLRRKKDT